MADTIKRGSLFPQGQRVVIRYDPQTGIVIDNDYNGAGQPEMQALFADLIASGIAAQLVLENDKASLQSTDSTQQTTLDTWEIAGSEESPDGLSHPTLLNFCSDDVIAATRSAIEGITAASPIQDQIESFFDTFPLSTIGGANKATLIRFIGLQIRGSTEYRKASYVVRHTTNCPSRNLPNIADVGINMIYNVSQFLSEVQSSGLWLFPMPANLVYQIANIPVPTFKDNYQWGWLKSPPTKSTAANNRINIVTEYQLDQWSTDYYAQY